MKPASIFALTLLAAVPALAQSNNMSWVSHSGSDLNPCTMAQPCHTFQVAYNSTLTNGIVKALDAGEYGLISISRPITIDGNGVGAAIEVVTSSPGTGVLVNTAGNVEIRNLAIHVANTCGVFCIGIYAVNGSVSIENVSITGAPGTGVSIGGPLARETATIHAVTVTGATRYGIIVDSATATISDSVVRYSDTGIALGTNYAVNQVLIERSKMISNTSGLTIGGGLFAATARISDCVITDNTTGTAIFAGGQIITFRNNTWAGNTTDGSTPFSASLK